MQELALKDGPKPRRFDPPPQREPVAHSQVQLAARIETADNSRPVLEVAGRCLFALTVTGLGGTLAGCLVVRFCLSGFNPSLAITVPATVGGLSGLIALGMVLREQYAAGAPGLVVSLVTAFGKLRPFPRVAMGGGTAGLVVAGLGGHLGLVLASLVAVFLGLLVQVDAAGAAREKPRRRVQPEGTDAKQQSGDGAWLVSLGLLFLLKVLTIIF